MSKIKKRGIFYQAHISMKENGVQKRLVRTFKTEVEAKWWLRMQKSKLGSMFHIQKTMKGIDYNG